MTVHQLDERRDENVAQETGPHLVPARVSLQEQRPRTLKHGDTFAVYDPNGDVLALPDGAEGLYHADTRHLSYLQLAINGERPMLLRSSLRNDNAALICDLSNPDIHDADGVCTLQHDVLHIRRVRLLWEGAAFERITIKNFDSRAHQVEITLGFAADFADIFEVRGSKRLRRGSMGAPKVDADSVTLSYTGLDHQLRTTQLRFDPPPRTLTANGARYVFNLEPGRTAAVFVEINCSGLPGATDVRKGFLSAFLGARRAARAAAMRSVAITTSNQTFNEATARSVSDLYMLCTETPEGTYPYAGVPWFSTVFGRDAIITALQTLWFDPSIALGVLRHLAVNQATEFNQAADSEPGKIVHEIRRSEMAELGEVPFRRYYGSVDSTPLFVMLAGAYLERTGDLDAIEKLWPNIEAALGWIENHGDRDRDGFVEYYRQTDAGLANQGWKDSNDFISHADGTLAEGAIALVEVQAYVYAAWRAAAEIARERGDKACASNLMQRADALRRRFDTHFYDAALGTYVIALDGAKRPCRVRSSNAGHALFTGIALDERVPNVAAALMQSFSGYGVRTLAASEARYNPMSYHNGSIWPHDNAIIAAGLVRYGRRDDAARIFSGLFEASTFMDLRRLPELFCGFPRQAGSGPVFYPVACAPQAWAAGAPLLLLQACLGLCFQPRQKRIVFVKPKLPAFLDEVVLSGLRVGDASADVALKRAGEDVLLHVLRRSGACSVEAIL